MKAQRRPPRATARCGRLAPHRERSATQLAELAQEAWQWAEQQRDRTPIRLVVRGGVERRVLGCEEDIRNVDNVDDARDVIALLLQGKRPSRISATEQTRHLAIWHMMNVLLEQSVTEPGAREGVVFPYPNPHAAAVAVVEGFRRARLHGRLTVDIVLQVYKRHFGSFHAP